MSEKAQQLMINWIGILLTIIMTGIGLYCIRDLYGSTNEHSVTIAIIKTELSSSRIDIIRRLDKIETKMDKLGK